MYQDGFYKYDGELFYAYYFVKGPDIDLTRENKDTYTYPIKGWSWFDSLQDACTFYGLNPDNYNKKEIEWQ